MFRGRGSRAPRGAWPLLARAHRAVLLATPVISPKLGIAHIRGLETRCGPFVLYLKKSSRWNETPGVCGGENCTNYAQKRRDWLYGVASHDPRRLFRAIMTWRRGVPLYGRPRGACLSRSVDLQSVIEYECVRTCPGDARQSGHVA